MRYLFGDSTESALEFNYLAFLRDAVDACVVFLQSDAGLSSGRERKAARERAASEAIHAVEAFGKSAHQLAEPVAHGSPETPVGRAAAAVQHAATDAVRRESAQARAALQADLELIESEGQRLRARCVAALGTLLQSHDLPEAEQSLLVRWTGTGYEARLKQKVKFGAEVLIELDIPSSSLFAHDVRIDRISDGAEIHAPESAGWLKKEVKMVPHKLGRHHVTEVIVDAGGVTYKLRVTPEAGAQGFDIHIGRKGDVHIDRAVAGDDGWQFETDDRDVGKLTVLGEKLEAAADALREHRRSLAGAQLDGAPLADHAHPRVLAERLIDAMTPVVRQIAQHSLSPSELVLKRLLAGDRREEIFVSKSELAQKLEALPASLRQAFAPLGLAEAAPPPTPAREPARDSAPPPPREPARESAPPPLPGVSERTARKTQPPPPPPPPRLPQAQTAAAIDTALRELDEAGDGGEPEPADATRPR
jgi:hypothetical protein